jgi:hypothetical protein
MGSDFTGAPHEVRVGRVVAVCPSCRHSSLFLRAKRKRLPKADSRICAGCGAEHFYTALLEQVTLRTIADAERALDNARSARRNRS